HLDGAPDPVRAVSAPRRPAAAQPHVAAALRQVCVFPARERIGAGGRASPCGTPGLPRGPAVFLASSGAHVRRRAHGGSRLPAAVRFRHRTAFSNLFSTLRAMHVSVIIPAHNAADTLAETLASLHAQTHPDWEAVVVNDGSTDATAAVAEAVAR